MDKVTRDERGRYRPGVSGNPMGRGPGRPPDAVNDLADRGVTAVLAHDLDVLDSEKATQQARRQSLDRLARLGARRITSEERVTIDEADVSGLVSIIAKHVKDPEVLVGIVKDLEAL